MSRGGGMKWVSSGASRPVDTSYKSLQEAVLAIECKISSLNSDIEYGKHGLFGYLVNVKLKQYKLAKLETLKELLKSLHDNDFKDPAELVELKAYLYDLTQDQDFQSGIISTSCIDILSKVQKLIKTKELQAKLVTKKANISYEL